MQYFNTNWSQKEFKAYLYLFVAQSNYIETKEESSLLLTKINRFLLHKIRKEINKDSLHKRVQKIVRHIRFERLESNDREVMLDDIQAICEADGMVDMMERRATNSLLRVFNGAKQPA